MSATSGEDGTHEDSTCVATRMAHQRTSSGCVSSHARPVAANERICFCDAGDCAASVAVAREGGDGSGGSQSSARSSSSPPSEPLSRTEGAELEWCLKRQFFDCIVAESGVTRPVPVLCEGRAECRREYAACCGAAVKCPNEGCRVLSEGVMGWKDNGSPCRVVLDQSIRNGVSLGRRGALGRGVEPVGACG